MKERVKRRWNIIKTHLKQFLCRHNVSFTGWEEWGRGDTVGYTIKREKFKHCHVCNWRGKVK